MERDGAIGLNRLRLGDILVARRLISREQLAEGLELAREHTGRLGEALLKLGHLAESDLKGVLANQLGLPYEPGPDLEVDYPIARLVTEQTAQQLQAIPLRTEDQVLIVATADPLNFQSLDHIALKSGYQVRQVVVTTNTLQRTIVKVFGLPEMEKGEQLNSSVYDITQIDENPMIRLVNTLMAEALHRRASDIHIEPLDDQLRVRYRIDGALVELTPLPLSKHAALISRLKVMAGMDIAERRIPQDGQVKIAKGEHRVDLRINTVPTAHGERMVVRLLERSLAVRGLDDMGMPAQEDRHFRAMISRPNGLILVTGPTGSGKSTTLMATLTTLNRPGVNILTIEDPVEYNVHGIGQVQVNLRAGLTFSAGLRAFLRQDPDILMVGEIRDGETADIAIRAAMTGHLVFSTLHTNQAAGAVGRLIDMGTEPFLLASSLLGVVAQRLVRLLCTRCKESYQVPEDSAIRHLPGVPEGPLMLYRARGCGFCDQIGYRGRAAIFEVLAVNPAIRDLIAGRASSSVLQAEAIRAGLMRTLWLTGLEQALAGQTSLDEIRRVAFAEA